MFELKTTVGTIFVMLIIFDVLYSALNPHIKHNLQEKRSFSAGFEIKKQYELCDVEKEYLLAEYDSILGVFDQYSCDAIHFGFMTMFISVFPLGALLFYVMSYVSIR